MASSSILLWVLLIAGSILAAWWLAVRPGASLRNLATPVAALIILMAVLLCLLALTGQEPGDLIANAKAFWWGH